MEKLNETAIDLPSDDQKKATLLHLCMVQSRLHTDQTSPPPEPGAISKLAKHFGIPPQLTYQLYFLENPREAPLTFYNGQIGADEILFQRSHWELETLCFKPICNVLLILTKQADYGDEAPERIQGATLKMQNASRRLSNLIKHFPVESFRSIVAYLSGTGVRYSAAFPIMDTLLLHHLPTYPAEPDLMPRRALASSDYATIEDLSEAQEIRQRYGSLCDVRRQLKRSHLQALLLLLKQYRAFRVAHLQGAVRKFVSSEASEVPEALMEATRKRKKIDNVLMRENGSLQFERAGTGGVSNIPVYLMDFIVRIEESIEILEKELG